EFAGIQAGSIYGVALKLATDIHDAAAYQIELVRNEDTERRLQELPECRLRWENDGGPNGIWFRSWEYSPFVITHQTEWLDLLEAWLPETWDAARAALCGQPLFDAQQLCAKIDCEWGRLKRRFETRPHEADQLRPVQSSSNSGINSVDCMSASNVVITD